jgi:hypothetical protein
MIFTTMLPISSLNVFADEKITIKYDFANEKAGFAEGTITLNVPSSDDYATYELYWSDDVKALDGYYCITELNANSETSSFSFLENVAIPPNATKVIAIKADSDNSEKTVELADAVFSIPQNKVNKYVSSDKTLSFMALSDTQIDLQSSVFYTYSNEHFAMALEDASQRDVDFVTMSGDCINNYESGTSKEWQEHQKIIANSSFDKPIYETNGNHSMKSDVDYGIQAYISATGLGVDTEELGDEPYYEITAANGDHFLFVALEGSSSVPTTDEFTSEQLDWLESTIEKYYNDGKHIYVFEHAFFHGWGPGDDKTEHYYSGGLRTTSDFPGNQRFKSIIDKYTEVFLYTGHSHLDFMYNWNYDNENGQTANMFHIPSTACTTHVTDGELDYTMNENDSQGYIVESYDDAVISYGLNIVDNLIYPAYTYIVDTSDYDHQPATQPSTEAVEPTTESENLIDVQIENATSYLYNDSAALYFYNNDSGNYYKVDSDTGIAQIPENATNLTLYRCKEDWNTGEEKNNDGITSYWNKYGPVERELSQTIFYVAGSSKYSWKEGEIVYPSTSPSTDPIETTASQDVTDDETTPINTMLAVQIDNATSYLYNDSAALYFYDNDTGEHYDVDSDTGIAYIPENATNLTLYRCKEAWNTGEEKNNDGITSYWNKYGPAVRQANQTIFYVAGSSKFNWKEGDVVYPTSEPSTDPAETTATTSSEPISSETTIYWAVPKASADAGYTYRINLKCTDGSYPHSPRVMTDTGKTYEGMEVYSYTFSEEYTAEYDELGIQRIQLQAAESSSSSAKTYFQYALTDKTYTVSELNNMIFVSPDENPSGTVNSDFSQWKVYSDEPQPSETVTEPTEEQPDTVSIEVIDKTSSGWVYSSGAALYLYDVDTQEHYNVIGGKVEVPAESSNYVLYRCDGEWGFGNKTDSVTTYWNKWDLTARLENYDIINLTGDGVSVWLSSETYEPEEEADYYLVGYFDGNDYEGRDYKFDENGQLTLTFKEDSYVYVISSANTSYWTNGWLGNDVATATMYRAVSLSSPDKLFVQSGKVTFTLVINEDGTLTLSYIYEPIDLDKSEIEIIYDDVMIGDVDLDGELSIIDATMIQKYLASIKSLNEKQLYAADIFGNGEIDISNVTFIQKYLAEVENAFPADDNYSPDVSTLEALANVSSLLLSTDYRYASYVAYSNLKSAYNSCTKSDISALSDEDYAACYDNLLTAYNDFLTMKQNNNIVTVYFCNDLSWTTVKAYCYNSQTEQGINTLETAQTISRIKTLECGAKIYCITINQSKWDKIIFTDGESNKTISLDIPSENHIGFYSTDCTYDEDGNIIPSKFKYNYDKL